MRLYESIGPEGRCFEKHLDHGFILSPASSFCPAPPPLTSSVAVKQPPPYFGCGSPSPYQQPGPLRGQGSSPPVGGGGGCGGDGGGGGGGSGGRGVGGGGGDGGESGSDGDVGDVVSIRLVTVVVVIMFMVIRQVFQPTATALATGHLVHTMEEALSWSKTI